jgi:hypothetical protein
MRAYVLLSLLSGVLALGACGAATRRSVDPCALVDSSLAGSLVGDRTGEPVDIEDAAEYAYQGCRWDRSSNSDADSLTVDAKVYDSDAVEDAEQDFRALARTWKCTTTIPTRPGSSACGYTANLDSGVIVHKDEVVVRIGYRGPNTPQHDNTRRQQVARQLASKALSAL